MRRKGEEGAEGRWSERGREREREKKGGEGGWEME